MIGVFSVQQISDEEYLIRGLTGSKDITPNDDVWLITSNPQGNVKTLLSDNSWPEQLFQRFFHALRILQKRS